MQGYLYVLSNPSMPGLIKIGKTTTSPNQRMSELYSTGVPTRFVIELSLRVDDCDSSERAAHSALASSRVPNREFFRVSMRAALEAILPVIGEYEIVEFNRLNDLFASLVNKLKELRSELEKIKDNKIDELLKSEEEQVGLWTDGQWERKEVREEMEYNWGLCGTLLIPYKCSPPIKNSEPYCDTCSECGKTFRFGPPFFEGVNYDYEYLSDDEYLCNDCAYDPDRIKAREEERRERIERWSCNVCGKMGRNPLSPYLLISLTYGINICTGCYSLVEDGWPQSLEPKITKNLTAKGAPIPQRNEKGLLPRGRVR